MRPASAFASHFSQFLTAAMLVSIACSETTTPARIPTKLAFTVQPPATIASRQIFPAVSVAIQDADGNTVTTATNSVTLSTGSNTPGTTLVGIVTVAAVNGVATFTNLSIDLASNYTLSAASPNLASASSVQFAVVAGPPAKLGFTVQPVTTLAHGQFPPVSVAVQDAAGNTFTTGRQLVTLALGMNTGGAVLSGGTSTTVANGIAVFTGLTIDKTGIGYTFVAASTGLTSAVSTPFDVTIGPASKLQFITQPSTTAPGAAISPAVTVAVVDVVGNLISTATNSITVSIGTNGGSGILSGTTTIAAVGGVATFSDLGINNPGSIYTLTAAASGLSSATSALFSIRNSIAFTAVSAGYFHTCGIAPGGVGYCWGDNSNGQLGIPNVSTTTAPLPISGGLTFANIGAGRDHTCGVTPGGVAYCWGSNESGRLGNGGIASAASPVVVFGALTFAAATAGYAHSCGATTTSVAYCWGNNGSGGLGNGAVFTSNSPSVVIGGLSFATVSPGRYFSCGLTNAGAGYCWGANSDGELGDGTNLTRLTPVPVSGQLTFAMISAGGFHACGLTTDGRAYCWGNNAYGQLGNGTNTLSSVPVAVSGGLTFAMISSGNRHSCGVTTAGRAYCWGDNSSDNLGDGTTINRATPVPVSGGLTFSTVSAGRFHSCGVSTAGTLYCWGTNNNGQLGDGTQENRLVPVPVR